MKNGDDFEAVTSQPVRNYVARARNYELACARHSAGTTEIRQVGQAFDGGQERHGDAASRVGVIARGVSTKVSKVADRAWRPEDGHARSQVDTSL